MADQNQEEQEEESSNWTQIPPELLLSITQSLKLYSDYIRLRAVCLQWRSSLPPTPPHNLPPQLPWLLLPPTGRRRTFFDLLTGKLHTLDLPEASYPRRIFGSSHGYLILAGDSPEIFSLNPLTKSNVSLPPLSSLPCVVSFSFSNVGREYSIRDRFTHEIYTLDLRQMRDVFIRKIILSASSIAVAIITSNRTARNELAFCSPGDTRWKSVDFSDFSAEDVVYCESEGLFYAVNEIGDVGVFDINVNLEKMMVIRSVNAIEGDLRYVVKSEGELLLLTRRLGAEPDVVSYCEVYKTVEFDVYRFRGDGDGRGIWDRVTHLGDRVVFVGKSSSLVLMASEFEGCRGNRVYFTDDHSEESDDVGVFDLGDRCVEALPCYCSQGSRLPLRWAPPVWVIPNPR